MLTEIYLSTTDRMYRDRCTLYCTEYSIIVTVFTCTETVYETVSIVRRVRHVLAKLARLVVWAVAQWLNDYSIVFIPTILDAVFSECTSSLQLVHAVLHAVQR